VDGVEVQMGLRKCVGPGYVWVAAELIYTDLRGIGVTSVT